MLNQSHPTVDPTSLLAVRSPRAQAQRAGRHHELVPDQGVRGLQ
jgi:hypothetical protein